MAFNIQSKQQPACKSELQIPLQKPIVKTVTSTPSVRDLKAMKRFMKQRFHRALVKLYFGPRPTRSSYWRYGSDLGRSHPVRPASSEIIKQDREQALRYELLINKRHVPLDVSLQDLEQRIIHHRRQLPSYELYAVDELASFVRARSIIPQQESSAPVQKAELVKTLKLADANPTFHRFLDLSPELRVMIYKEHCRDFPQMLQNPISPPLARVSKAIRKEVLPVFWSSAIFAVDYVPDSKATSALSLSASSHKYIKQLPIAAIRFISNICIRLMNDDNDEAAAVFCLNHNKATKSVHLQRSTFNPCSELFPLDWMDSSAWADGCGKALHEVVSGALKDRGLLVDPFTLSLIGRTLWKKLKL